MDFTVWRQACSPIGRLERVLRAARSDPYYAPILNCTLVPRAPARLSEALAPLPYSPRDEWGRDRRLPSWPALMRHPLNPRLRAAFPGRRGAYTVIAAPAAHLLELARSSPGHRPAAEHGVLALERPGDPVLEDVARDLLWDAFEVPVYRVLIGFDGATLAYECEALRGLHTAPGAVFEECGGRVWVTSLTDLRNPSIRLDTGIMAQLDSSPCDCGRPGVRLTPVWWKRSRLSSAAD